MTRQEFLDDIDCFYDLKDFCNRYDLDVCEYIMDQDELDSWIDDCLADWARWDGWRDVRDRLVDIPTGYDWYDTEDDIVGLNDGGRDFEHYKHLAFEAAKNNDVFEDEVESESSFEDEIPFYHHTNAGPCCCDESRETDEEQIDPGEFLILLSA